MRRLLVHSTAGRLIAVLGSLALALMLSCVLDSALRTDVRASAVQTAPAGQPIRISVVQPDNDLRGIALSLGNDAGRLYEFVRNEFVFEPIYGYLKGPWMTVLQGSGSACDLAALLVALLRLAGHEAQFVIGAAKIAASELDEWVPIAANWIGVPPDADSILRAFRRGRIASAQFQEDGIPYVSIDHVWVRAKIDGLWYELDPSFKQYRVLDGLDMAEAIGFDGHEFLVGSLSGAEIAENYVRNVGSNAIEAELSSLATLLSGFLRTEIPGEAVDAALGSRTIIPEPFDRSTTTLPYSTIIRNVSDTLPDDMVYRLRLEASGSVYEVALPDISGTRITLFPSTDGQSTLAVNGEAVGTITLGSEADDNSIGVAILEPNGEGYEREKTFSSETPYGIVVSVGTPTDSLLEERNAILRLAMASGHETHEESVLGELIHIMGLTWFSEKSRICSVITSPLSGVNYIPEYGVAFVTGSPAYGIDVKIDSRVFVSGPMAHRDTERALDVLEGIIASACEHAHIEQLLDIEAVSTIAGLCQASNEGLQLFRLTADNKDEVIPSLQYPTSRLERWEEGLETGDITSIILPERPVAVENWVGNAYVEQGPGGSSYKIGTLRGGLSLSGGDFGDLPARLSLRSSLAVSDCARGWTNIDEMSGRLLVASQDLQVAGLPPTSVGAFIRTYDSGSLKQDGLGYGWSHGWQSSLCSTSNWRRGLGNLSADEAAVLIVSSLASLSALDWRQDDAPIPVERWVIASIASNWALEQLTDNAIVISLPTGESATFLEHAGGFSCPSAHLNLEASPEREYALEDPLGNRFEFGPSGRLECWSDASGNELRAHYSVQGDLVAIEDSHGRRLDLEWDEGTVRAVVDPLGRSVKYAYDSLGNLTQVTGPDGSVTSYTYDTGHRLTSITAPDGAVLCQYSYDWRDRITTQSDDQGFETQYLYGHMRTVVTDPTGSQHVYRSDAEGQLKELIDPFAETWRWEYDSRGNLVRQENPLGEAWTYSYDNKGLLVTAGDPLGASWGFAYDGFGQVIRSEDPLDGITQYAYDGGRHIASRTDPTGLTWEYEYDGPGNLTRIEDPLQQATTMSYDEFGYLSTLELPTGLIFSSEYDATGLLLSMASSGSEIWSFEYDPNGSLDLARDPLGGVTAYEYDTRRRLIAVTDPLERTTRYVYDDRTNIIAVVLPDSSDVRYVFDDASRLVAMTDRKGATTTLERDSGGRVISFADPLERETRYSYDVAHRLQAESHPSGSQVSYRYDLAGRLIEIVDGEEDNRSFEYDEAGRLVTATSRKWSARYSYDLAGRMIKACYPYSDADVTYAYDEAGRRVALHCSVRDEAVLDVEYVYGNGDQLVGLQSGQEVYTFDHNQAGQLEEIGYPNGTSTNYVYDELGRVLQLGHADPSALKFSQRVYEYDQTGNVLSIEQLLGEESEVVRYAYDQLDRLVLESHLDGDIAYTYDLADNRVRVDYFGDVITYVYDAADQIVRAGASEYVHDEDGNLISVATEEGVHRFTYDSFDQLREILAPSGDVYRFAHDAFGRIAALDAGGDLFEVIYDGSKILALVNATDGIASAYVYGADGWLLASTGASSATTYFHLDRLGSLISTTNRLGEVTSSCRYDAFGNTLAETGTLPKWLGYLAGLGVIKSPGCEGVFIMGQRHYDSTSGRFLTQDPVQPWARDADDMNSYSYGKSNPLRYVDPEGLCAVDGGNSAEDAESLAGKLSDGIDIAEEGLGYYAPRSEVALGRRLQTDVAMQVLGYAAAALLYPVSAPAAVIVAAGTTIVTGVQRLVEGIAVVQEAKRNSPIERFLEMEAEILGSGN